MIMTDQLNEYAKSKGVTAQVTMSLDGSTYGLFVPPGVLEHESSSAEAIAVHIDIMALARVEAPHANS